MQSADKPRCIVLPFQDRQSPGTGLALQFLLSNVIAAHSVFKECWFGWRTAKIFPQPEELKQYCAGRAGELDLQRLAADQNVPCWVYGRAETRAVEVHVFNARAQVADASDTCGFSTEDDLVGFRRCFIDVLGRAGFPVPQERLPLMLWPENVDRESLRRIGQALELFYIHSAFVKSAEIDPAPFRAAVQAAPDSFMAHDLLGWAYYRRQVAAQAKASFLKALLLCPDAIGPMAGLAGCAVLEKDRNSALYWAVRKAFMQNEDVATAVEKTHRKFNP